ncbi:hypothetical protein AAEX37_00653 [Oligella sp. MSHR50489EDL]
MLWIKNLIKKYNLLLYVISSYIFRIEAQSYRLGSIIRYYMLTQLLVWANDSF